MQLDYGKRITRESYFGGKLKSTKVEYSVPILIMDRPQALSEIMKALDLITTKQTNQVTITIEADSKTHNLKMITKNYTIDL